MQAGEPREEMSVACVPSLGAVFIHTHVSLCISGWPPAGFVGQDDSSELLISCLPSGTGLTPRSTAWFSVCAILLQQLKLTKAIITSKSTTPNDFVLTQQRSTCGLNELLQLQNYLLTNS